MVHPFKEHNFFADVDSTANSKHATDKVPHSDAIKWHQFLITRKIDHPTLETFNSWLKPIAQAMERIPHLTTMPHQENITATFRETCYAPQVSTIRSNDTSNYGNLTLNGNLKALSAARALRKMLPQSHNFLLAIPRFFVP